jgi:pyruvate/2-oxoglutarate/acetoin dehydrogenase E1 component
VTTFKDDTEAGATTRLTFVQAVNASLDHALARDPKVIILGEDVSDPSGGGPFKATKGLSTKYGEHRVRNTPIAEQAIIGSAIGAALAGYRPVAEIMFMDFIGVAMDQIVNHAAKLRFMSGGATPVPMTIRTMIGQQRFGAQHTQSLEAWFMHIPGIKVVMPSTPRDAKGLLTSCLRDEDPCLFIENVNLMFAQKGDVPDEDYAIPLGRADIKRSGGDVTIITYGAAVHTALEAADVLQEQDGVSAEVVDLRSLVPLDFETVLESVGRTRRAVVLHEATVFCGPGAEIAARIHEDLFDELLAPVMRVGAAYAPAAYAASGLPFLPVADDVVSRVRSLF